VIAWMTDLVRQYPFLIGGVSVGIFGTTLAYLKDIPGFISEWLMEQAVCSIFVTTSEDRGFDWLNNWIHNQPSLARSRKLCLSVRYEASRNRREILHSCNENSDVNMTRAAFTPAPGRPHSVWFKGKKLWITRKRDDKPDSNGKIFETIRVSMPGRSTATLKELIEDARIQYYANDIIETKIYLQDGNEWEKFASRPPRLLDSVYLDKSDREALIVDLDEFRSNKQWYTTRGLSYKRGYLFHGPPGSGKSSLAAAIAGHLKRNIYSLSLSTEKMNDLQLLHLVSSVPRNGILLIEDIDALFMQREKTEDASRFLTFSGLLNALDGVCLRDGLIVIMTTNHIEKLDPALIRPGRIDFRLLLSWASYDQAKAAFEAFFPGCSGLILGLLMSCKQK